MSEFSFDYPIVVSCILSVPVGCNTQACKRRRELTLRKSKHHAKHNSLMYISNSLPIPLGTPMSLYLSKRTSPRRSDPASSVEASGPQLSRISPRDGSAQYVPNRRLKTVAGEVPPLPSQSCGRLSRS